MSNVIQFLEKIATTATLTDDNAWKNELATMELDPEIRQALENRDHAEIEKLLGSDTNLMAVFFPAEDDEPSKEEEPSDDEQEEHSRLVG